MDRLFNLETTKWLRPNIILFSIRERQELKKVKRKVFSLLTGGGGNNNYYHWLFDVLPRLVILREKIKLTDIDYFLFPRIDLPFQKQSLDLLNIPITKRLSSQTFRHVYADEIIAVDHPCVILNDPLKDNENIPDWIINFYKDELKIKVNFEKNMIKYLLIETTPLQILNI